MYCGFLTLLFSTSFMKKQMESGKYISLLLFVALFSILALASAGLRYTYDTSWDGQGYHQSAIIALSNGWNPVYQPLINFKQHLPSQIFAEGYPSALWEIQASIYSLTGWINSAKVMNLAIAIIAAQFLYILARKLNISKFIAVLLSLLVVIQPVFLIQFLTFMQDGFGYQLLVIAITSLIIIILDLKAHWAVLSFLMAAILLVSTKYSHLPIALILGIIFMFVVVNRFMNIEYRFNKFVKGFLVIFFVCSAVFAYLPYIRNGLAHSYFFYPTNIPELMGSVAYNNVPKNLDKDDKFKLLFYGIFSRSQDSSSGDPRAAENVAHLKMPFTFSMDEIEDSVSLYNNRVGAAGPLFSGIAFLSLAFLTFVTFRTKNVKERYIIYSSFFIITGLLVFSLFTPAPNLLRYVSQIQLLPFAVIIPLYAGFKSKYLKASS
jgi:hypothetical protein